MGHVIIMTGTSKIEIKCVKCKKIYESDVIDHIDLSLDRNLIKSLRSGKVNRTQCPKCKKVMYPDRSIVINFEPQSLIVVFDPKAKSKKAKDELLKDYAAVISFSEVLEETAQETEFKIVTDLEVLKELLSHYVKTYM